MEIYKGHIIFTEKPEAFTIHKNGYVVVEGGKVKFVGETLPQIYQNIAIKDFGESLLIPGFVDLHFHAPQYANLGLGLDKELLPWLTDYTFPEEAKYSDLAYAEGVYRQVAHDLWRNGTTRVVLFSTLHIDATKLLMDLFDESGLGAYIGKVNMDRNSPDFLIETTENSLADTENWLKTYANKYELVKPIISPRFVPTCTSELMYGLGALAKQYQVPIQSHISENKGECEWVKELHPTAKNYADIYEQHGLLTSSTIMAHCVHNTMEEIGRFKENGVFSAHCPNANYNLSSGIMPVRKFMDAGVKVGLGTDVGAGHKVSIASVMTSAMQASKIAWLESEKALAPLSTSEAFYLGTKGGGEFFGKVGSFEIGYDFDALVIDDTQLKITPGRSLEERLQRFIYVGDDRHITHRFVNGSELKEPKR
jgi:guanine deaminase